MYRFTTALVRLFISAIVILALPLTALTGTKQARIKPAGEDCGVAFAAISDIHLRDSKFFGGILSMGLEDMENAEEKLDAVAFVGDITDHGYTGMWDTFEEAVGNYDISDNLFVIAGNHDTWGPNRGDFSNPVDGVKPTFIEYNKRVSGREISEMYYSDVVNGYYFIALGSEYDSTCAYLSDAQLSWFADEMEKASATGLPVFVFCHQPVNETHGLPYNWELDESQPADKGGIGDQSSAVLDIMKKCDNVFYISGHIHAGFKNEGDGGVKYASVEYVENNNGNDITLINLPSYMYPDLLRGSHVGNGYGWIVEAYGDRVMLRARNFIAGCWLTQYDVTVPLV